MADADALRALLERVEAAGGPDRVLGIDLLSTLCPNDYARGNSPGDDDPVFLLARMGGSGFHVIDDIDPTASLDAAVALVEAVLPPIKSFAPGSPPSSGWKINLYRGMTPTGEPHASWECCIRPHAGAEKWHRAPTAALAVLCALLSALLARAGRPNP